MERRAGRGAQADWLCSRDARQHACAGAHHFAVPEPAKHVACPERVRQGCGPARAGRRCTSATARERAVETRPAGAASAAAAAVRPTSDATRKYGTSAVSAGRSWLPAATSARLPRRSPSPSRHDASPAATIRRAATGPVWSSSGTVWAGSAAGLPAAAAVPAGPAAAAAASAASTAGRRSPSAS